MLKPKTSWHNTQPGHHGQKQGSNEAYKRPDEVRHLSTPMSTASGFRCAMWLLLSEDFKDPARGDLRTPPHWRTSIMRWRLWEQRLEVETWPRAVWLKYTTEIYCTPQCRSTHSFGRVRRGNVANPPAFYPLVSLPLFLSGHSRNWVWVRY